MSKETTPGTAGSAQRSDPLEAGGREPAQHAGEALHAVTRLLSAAAEPKGPDALGSQLVDGAREFFGVARALLLCEAGGDDDLRVVAASPAIDAPHPLIRLTDFAVLDELFGQRRPDASLLGAPALELDHALGAREPCESLLLLPMSSGDTVSHVLLLAASEERSFSAEEKEVALAFATAAAVSFAQLRLTEAQSAQTARQAALARAAKTLNESLDLNRVLVRICQEAASILAADYACVYRGSSEGIVIDATYGMPPEAVGYRLASGAGLAGKVAELDRPLLTNDYQGMPRKADEMLFGETRSSLAVPLHWDGELNGVLAVGYTHPHEVTREQLGLLEAFGELAAAACRNASAHMGLAHAARTDGLTGCLNHAAMHDALRREIERCERTGHRLSLVLVDMDDFKRVNEEHGHLAGDEVLRSVGKSLRQATRPYDLVARYGGDEFAIVTIEADEDEAEEVATRALADVSGALTALRSDAAPGGASAGVAEWAPEESSTTLIERADRALLFGKQEGEAGSVTTASSLPASYRPGRFQRGDVRAAAEPAPAEVPEGLIESGRRQTDRLRKRTRQLALANALGTRLAAMTDPQAILDAAVEELHRAFGFHLCSVVRVGEDDMVEIVAARGDPLILGDGSPGWEQSRGDGLIGRCLRERRPVIVDDVASDASYIAGSQSANVKSELVVPLWVGETMYGAIDIEEVRQQAFDEDDARLVQTVADQVGSALRSATLYEQLERAYLGTAEALAAALEAKDSYSAAHSRAVVERAQAVSRRLGLAADAVRTVRYAAIFHDIGKIAVPEAILNKRGPLNEHERREIERHSIVGERILSSVDFLEDVLPLVRHEHERWDGTGYPDRLAGEAIPLGSRIILACDAYDAMTSDRPYRAAMSDGAARSELLSGTGAQFDERVVSALLQELDDRERQGQPDVSAAR